MQRDIFAALIEGRNAGRTLIVATHIESGSDALIDGDRIVGDGDLARALAPHLAAILAADESASVETALGQVFVRLFAPPLRLILVGAVHIAQVLAPMAALAGYAVTVIDPRSAFATEARFPGVRLVAEWPDAAMKGLAPDRRTAVVTLTHDPKLDEPALEAALASSAFYVGALGSRKTAASRNARLIARGLAERDVARVRAPVGLAIGARSPAEIAISIMAEVTAIRHRPRESEPAGRPVPGLVAGGNIR